jgi:hypothetical protein
LQGAAILPNGDPSIIQELSNKLRYQIGKPTLYLLSYRARVCAQVTVMHTLMIPFACAPLGIIRRAGVHRFMRVLSCARAGMTTQATCLRP